MTKKKETVKSVGKTMVLRGADNAADPNDPVTIFFNDQLIGSLNSDETSGSLQTANTFVPNNIDIVYTEQGGSVTPVNVTAVITAYKGFFVYPVLKITEDNELYYEQKFYAGADTPNEYTINIPLTVLPVGGGTVGIFAIMANKNKINVTTTDQYVHVEKYPTTGSADDMDLFMISATNMSDADPFVIHLSVEAPVA